MSAIRALVVLDFARHLIHMPPEEREMLLDVLGHPPMQEQDRAILAPIYADDAMLAAWLQAERPDKTKPAVSWLPR